MGSMTEVCKTTETSERWGIQRLHNAQEPMDDLLCKR